MNLKDSEETKQSDIEHKSPDKRVEEIVLQHILYDSSLGGNTLPPMINTSVNMTVNMHLLAGLTLDKLSSRKAQQLNALESNPEHNHLFWITQEMQMTIEDVIEAYPDQHHHEMTGLRGL